MSAEENKAIFLRFVKSLGRTIALQTALAPQAPGETAFHYDCVLERSGFELSVPIVQQPDDSWLFGSVTL